jgi:NADPH:quinone reductase-like Zn-dependent oxidoreductase
VGINIRTFKPGDRVLALAEATYAQRVVVEGSIVTHLPDGVDLIDAAAIPLIALTGEQLIRVAARAQSGQTFVVTGALGSVGRAAIHTANKLGVRVIAGVRARQLEQARALDVSDVVAMDEEAAIAALPMVDGIADTVGGDAAAKLFHKVKNGGQFAYASVLAEGLSQRNPAVTITRVFARPDASKVREFADDIRDGKFLLPIGRRMPLRDAGEAHALAQKGGAGKIVLVCGED